LDQAVQTNIGESINHDLTLPNIRKLFIPDPGKNIYDVDLSGADAQVVAWEAEDEDLKEAFKAGLKIHHKNAEDMWGTQYTQADEHERAKRYKQIKAGVHGTNYGGSARTIAITLGWTVHEADQFQTRWFDIHPGIKRWHKRVEKSLSTTRSVSNAFGYRIIYFDRIDNVFTQALAWIPQSTVAIVCRKGGLQLHKNHPEVDLLLQVHDSWVFQRPTFMHSSINSIKSSLEVVTPYDDPLVIPWEISYSPVSWGDCVEMDW